MAETVTGPTREQLLTRPRQYVALFAAAEAQGRAWHYMRPLDASDVTDNGLRLGDVVMERVDARTWRLTATGESTTVHVPTWPDDGQETYYGRRVWDLGEDNDEGVMVQGHDRRSLAALCAHLRGQGVDPGDFRLRDVARRWVAEFAETCGCTEEQHQQHLDEAVYCGDGGRCAHDGLPPCAPEQFAWVPEYADVPGAPALPVLVVTW